MWQLAILALASATSIGKDEITVDNEAFGKRRHLTCTWFTNFENSRFEQCYDATGRLFRDGNGASIRCTKEECKRLDAATRRAAGWRKPEPPWGTFTVQLVGRVSLFSHQKRYLGDATRTVLIEKVQSVRVPK
ncbi:hypothetical protein [Sphingobium nicotianae]|uniref:Uncharacterized protein n=1 Tax=Sphingobium nicotianae TaxID=2782607 RepID=A0A9X1DC56_9SPHN|nr:hypothetical protein [Sphingobium nicotianae]MBT2187251.1 hypothetical protein [Sphingobium nicotianae]